MKSSLNTTLIHKKQTENNNNKISTSSQTDDYFQTSVFHEEKKIMTHNTIYSTIGTYLYPEDLFQFSMANKNCMYSSTIVFSKYLIFSKETGDDLLKSLVFESRNFKWNEDNWRIFISMKEYLNIYTKYDKDKIVNNYIITLDCFRRKPKCRIEKAVFLDNTGFRYYFDRIKDKKKYSTYININININLVKNYYEYNLHKYKLRESFQKASTFIQSINNYFYSSDLLNYKNYDYFFKTIDNKSKIITLEIWLFLNDIISYLDIVNNFISKSDRYNKLNVNFILNLLINKKITIEKIDSIPLDEISRLSDNKIAIVMIYHGDLTIDNFLQMSDIKLNFFYDFCRINNKFYIYQKFILELNDSAIIKLIKYQKYIHEEGLNIYDFFKLNPDGLDRLDEVIEKNGGIHNLKSNILELFLESIFQNTGINFKTIFLFLYQEKKIKLYEVLNLSIKNLTSIKLLSQFIPRINNHINLSSVQAHFIFKNILENDFSNIGCFPEYIKNLDIDTICKLDSTIIDFLNTENKFTYKIMKNDTIIPDFTVKISKIIQDQDQKNSFYTFIKSLQKNNQKLNNLNTVSKDTGISVRDLKTIIHFSKHREKGFFNSYRNTASIKAFLSDINYLLQRK